MIALSFYKTSSLSAYEHGLQSHLLREEQQIGFETHIIRMTNSFKVLTESSKIVKLSAEELFKNHT